MNPPSVLPRILAAKLLVAIAGAGFLASGLLMIFLPEWTFANLAAFHHPPFNRHYMGDAGVFVGALGAGALIAILGRTVNRTMLLVVLWASVLHAANHLYDALGEFSWANILVDVGPNALIAALLAIGYFLLGKPR